jgi:hypothetical protein
MSNEMPLYRKFASSHNTPVSGKFYLTLRCPLNLRSPVNNLRVRLSLTSLETRETPSGLGSPVDPGGTPIDPTQTVPVQTAPPPAPPGTPVDPFGP